MTFFRIHLHMDTMLCDNDEGFLGEYILWHYVLQFMALRMVHQNTFEFDQLD